MKMPRAGHDGNGKKTARVDRLEEAMTAMLSTQASFLSRTSEMDREMGAMRRDLDDMRRDLHDIRTTLSGFGQQLESVVRMIERLPDAVKEKVGFRG